MSFDNVSGITPILDIQGLPYIGNAVLQEALEPSLVTALASASSAVPESGLILRTDDDASTLDGGVGPFSSSFELDTPIDDGCGYIAISEPTIYVPEGFDVDDLYAVEFILDSTTGVLTINLLFSTDPLDFQMGMIGSLSAMALVSDNLIIGSDFGDISAAQAAPTSGSRCTVTLTKTVTQTSPTSSVTLFGGLVSFTMTSGTTTTTTTKTISVEGQMVNGRCVVVGDKH